MSEPTGLDHNIDPVSKAWKAICHIGAIKLIVAIAMLLNAVQIFGFQSHRQKQQDFAHYYVSSKLWLEGQQVYGVDLTPHYEELGWTQFDEPVEQATNPPTLLTIFAPLSSLHPQVAHTAWMLVQLLAFVSAVWFSWQCVKGTISIDGFWLMLAVFMFLPFLKAHFFYSQVQLVLMAMVIYAHHLTLAANESESDSPTQGLIACVVVAIAALIKIYPLVLLPWFVWRSSKHLLGRIAASVVAGLTLVFGVWLTDFQLWKNFIEFGLSTVSIWVRASHECFTIGSALHLFGTMITGELNSNLLVRSGSIIGASLLGLFFLRLVIKADPSHRRVLNIEFALLILLMLFCGATCWLHYLVFLLLPLLVIASIIKDRLTFASLVMFALVVLLFARFDVPETNIKVLERLLDQQPLIAMFVMAAFLAFNLKSSEHLTVTDR